MIFKPELAEAILRGEKTATRRKFSDNRRSPWWEHGCSYMVGQVFTINPGRGVPRVGEARVTAVYSEPLGHMVEADALKEGFRPEGTATALAAFDESWETINGEYFADEAVWVIEFELVGEHQQVVGRAA